MIGLNLEGAKLSTYQPPKDVALLTGNVRQDYQQGFDNLHEGFTEYNDLSLIDRMNKDQKLFNLYVEPRSIDPDESWRRPVKRSTMRNKIISMAAHLTASVLIPTVFAQNDNDEADEIAAEIMRDLMKYEVDDTDFELTQFYGVIAALVNPVAYMNQEFVHATQTVRERLENGDIAKHEVLDELNSGIQHHNVPADEVMFVNAYEFDLQRQRALIRKRQIEFSDAKSIYGDHDNIGFVRPGVQAFFNSDDGMFYEQFDEDHHGLVEEVTYMNRTEDMEVTFVNGVYMSNSNVEDNLFSHRDTMNRPKYPYTKMGFEPIDEKRFYGYKSAVNKAQHETELFDEMWQLVRDGTFLDVMPPVAVSGEDRVDRSIMFPASVTYFSPDTNVREIAPARNLNAAYNYTNEIERGLSASLQDDVQQGVQGTGQQTAFEISRLEQNARIQLGVFGKQFRKMIEDFGLLLIEDIVHHRTVAEVREVLGGRLKLKFPTFILPDQEDDGRSVTKIIRFTNDLLGREPSPEQLKDLEKKIFEEEGGFDGEQRIYAVNPAAFRALKWKVKMSDETLLPKNELFDRAMKLEAYDRMIPNPLIDAEAVTKDFLVKPFANQEAQKYMKKGAQAQLAQQPEPEQAQGSDLVQQITGTDSVNALVRP